LQSHLEVIKLGVHRTQISLFRIVACSVLRCLHVRHLVSLPILHQPSCLLISRHRLTLLPQQSHSTRTPPSLTPAHCLTALPTPSPPSSDCTLPSAPHLARRLTDGLRDQQPVSHSLHSRILAFEEWTSLGGLLTAIAYAADCVAHSAL
jgi:hypothetical protein